MWIVNLKTNPNGSHNNHRADHIIDVPDGCAMIPDGFPVPSSFPFVTIEAAETADGVMTVIAMTAGSIPEEPDTEPEPTQLDMLEAQVTYTAMMTDTLLEV